MILIDTNVLSEPMRPAPEAAVKQWWADQPEASVSISAITEAELRYGARLMLPGKRQTALIAETKGMIGQDLAGRIRPFDSPAAAACAEIAAHHRQSGPPVTQADVYAAAIARRELARRNEPIFRARCSDTASNDKGVHPLLLPANAASGRRWGSCLYVSEMGQLLLASFNDSAPHFEVEWSES